MYKYLSFFFLCLLFFSCSTSKNTWLSRNYHNTTDHFNVEFNAEQAYLEGIRKIEAQQEDYTVLLPVFNYGTDNSHKAALNDMDKCIKKSSVAIDKHSIFIRGVEYCKWIDENYQLIGQSYFIKREYFTALENFDYASKQYKKSPTRFIARLWLVRCYGELGNMQAADQMLENLLEDKQFAIKKYTASYFLAKADIEYKKHEYAKCIISLETAILKVKSRKTKTRLYYLLAQLYEQEGNKTQALMAYKKVIKYKPNNKMLFYAKIARTKNFDGTEQEALSLEKELLRMTKDIKYEEFSDQIFFALSNLAEQRENEKLQIEYLNKCVKAASSNTKQKAIAHLKLGNINYKNEFYKLSYQHYDSALSSASKKELPDYIALDSRRSTLKRLVSNLDTIHYEDSMQVLAKMDPTDQEKFIEKYIKEQKRIEEEQKELALQDALLKSNVVKSTIDVPGGWYFYNTNARALGIQDFINKWGTRIVEDNWRRSVKENLSSVNEDITEEQDNQSQIRDLKSNSRSLSENEGTKDNLGEIANPESTPRTDNKVPKKEKVIKNKTPEIKDVSYYLNTIPKGDSALKKSTNRIVNAYYAAASIYREELSNNEKAIKLFEELLNRFPENKFKLVSYYQLYRLYLVQGNTVLSDKYKNIILKDYEFSEYGQLISDPKFNVENDKAKTKAGKLYEQAFDAYKENEYLSVVSISNTALRLYKQNELAPKFLYLRALALSKTQSISAMVEELNNLILKYPSDPIKLQAQAVLAATKKINIDSLSNNVKDSISVYDYNENDNDNLFYCLIVKKADEVEKIKNVLGDFVNKNFEIENFFINSLLFEDNTYAIIVKTMKSKELAKSFIKKLSTEKTFELYKTPDSFFTTQPNLTKLFGSKKLKEYKRFYAKFYPDFMP